MTRVENEPFLRQIIDHVAHAVFVKDRSLRWVFANRAFCELLKLPLDQVVGKSQYDFCTPEEAEFYHAADLAIFASGASPPQPAELVFTDKDGVRHAYVTTKVAMLDDAGKVSHIVAVIHDVTELRELQSALRQTNQQLERRVEERTEALQKAQLDLIRKERLTELGKLAGGVAHEIRNPLSAINNAAYVLGRHFGKDALDETREALAIVHEEVRRANHIVSELLDYARVREPERRLVSIATLVEGAVKSADLPPGIDLRVADVDGTLNVFVDATQCEAALANVIRNSSEAMHGKGKVTIDVADDQATVTLRVRDEGPGVPSEVESRLFEPLVTTKSSGLGLGLVTARRLVEGQGGALQFERTDGVGACFSLALPRSA